MEIQKLPDDVVATVQSGITIADATQCVLELVFNSIDANATSVAVRLNLKKFFIQVVDNGVGLTKKDLSKLCHRHMTSKCHNVEELESIISTFGYRGSALASIKEICQTIEIQTLHHLERTTCTLILGQNKEKKFYENKTCRPSHGMTVTVTDLMCSLPVRRKRIKEVFDLDDIVHQIEALAAIHCHISFSVRNDSLGKVLLQTHRHEDPRETLSELFGLAPNKQLIPIANGRGNIRVSGFVSKELHNDTNIQLVYVNRRIIYKCKIHKLVVNAMKKYGGFWEKDRNESDDAIDVEGYVFIIMIECPYPSYTLSRNGRKTTVEFQNIQLVLKCVYRAVVQVFKDGSCESSLEDVAIDQDYDSNVATTIKGSRFGPSQLQNAVQGRRVVRESEEPTACVPKGFFEEISGEGTALPENAPVFEMPDFSQFSFHDFLAWLQIQAHKNPKAAKFLADFASMRHRNQIKPASAPLVSLKEVRKEKFENWKNMMLKKMEESRHLTHRPQSGITRKLIHRETTTIQQTPTWASITQTPMMKNLPHVSFGEFLTWMKYKANHDTTANQMLNEFHCLKSQPRITKRVVSQHWTGCESQSKRLLLTPRESIAEKPSKMTSTKGIQCQMHIQLPQVEVNLSPLYSTWKSHHTHPTSTMRGAEFFTPKRADLPPVGHFYTTPNNTNNISTNIEINSSLVPVLVGHQEVQACPLMKAASTQTTPKSVKKLINASIQTDPVLVEKCASRDFDTADTVPTDANKENQSSEIRFMEFEPPVTSTRRTFNFTEKTPPLPSLHQEQIQQLQVVVADSCEDLLASVKWGGHSEEKELREIHGAGAVINEERIISAQLPKTASKIEAVLSSVAFSPDDLKSANIIGQVDKKFFAVLIKKTEDDGQKTEILCLMDQHAVHERITLERLLQEYYHDGKIIMEDLDCAFPLTVSKTIIDLFNNGKSHFEENGIFASNLGASALLIRAVPACFIRRQEREMKSYRSSSLKRTVADLIEELAEHLMDTRGAGLSTPTTITNVIASEACRSAIKFNQVLSHDEMKDMLQKLNNCQLPFQCAHGRPSIAPVFKIENPTSLFHPARHNYQKFKKK